jgi:hypothetical protein
MMENSNKLVAKKYYDFINKRNLKKLVNSGTKDPEAEVLLKPKRESLSQMVKRMSGFRNAVRLPPNATEGLSENKGNAPKTIEEALAEAKKNAARGSVRRPDDEFV